MTEQKSTPGPWHVPKDIPGPRVFGSDGWLVADCCGICHRSVAEEKANARLIAAAPDLLEACKMVIKEGLTGPSLDAVRYAIAKAEGVA